MLTFRFNGLRFRFSDADRWITVKPNGPENKGRPVRIDADTGIVKGGMGGKFTGQHIHSAHKAAKAAPAATKATAPAASAAKPSVPTPVKKTPTKAPVAAPKAPVAKPAAAAPAGNAAPPAAAPVAANAPAPAPSASAKDLMGKMISSGVGSGKKSWSAQKKMIGEILGSAASSSASAKSAPAETKTKVKVKPASAAAPKAKVKVNPSPAPAANVAAADGPAKSWVELMGKAFPYLNNKYIYPMTAEKRLDLREKMTSAALGGKTPSDELKKEFDKIFENYGLTANGYSQIGGDSMANAAYDLVKATQNAGLWSAAPAEALAPIPKAKAKAKVKVKPAPDPAPAHAPAPAPAQGKGLSSTEIISKHFPNLYNEDAVWIDEHWDNPKKNYAAFKKDVIESAIGSEKLTSEDRELINDVLRGVGFDNAVDGVDTIDVKDIERAITHIKAGLEVLHNKSKSPAKPALTGPTGTAQLSSVLKQLHEAKSRGNDYHSSGVLLGDMIRDSAPVRPDWAVQTDPDCQYVHYDGQTSYGYESHEFAQPTSQLSDGETLSLENYSGDGYHDINDYYRKKKKYDELDPTTQEDLANLEAAFDKAETTRDMTLVRGISLGALAACLDVDGNFKDDAYLSCSALAANSFAASGMDVAVVYRVPAGAKALSLDGVSQFPGESEILLNRGTEGKLVGLEYDPTYKKYVAYVNVID